MCALAGAVWQANRWVIVVSTGKSRWAASVVARFGVDAIGFFANETIRCTVELFGAGW